MCSAPPCATAADGHKASAATLMARPTWNSDFTVCSLLRDVGSLHNVDYLRTRQSQSAKLDLEVQCRVGPGLGAVIAMVTGGRPL
jgi:predicted HD phosphohydrolase